MGFGGFRIPPETGTHGRKAIPATIKTEPKIPPKGLPVIPMSKISGDPIHQLNRSRNVPLIPKGPGRKVVQAGDYTIKRPVHADITQTLDIKRAHPLTQARDRSRVDQVAQDAIIEAGAQVRLNENGISGIQVYRGTRVKPALPAGRMDIPAPTRADALVGVDYFHQHMPIDVPARLAREAQLRENVGSDGPIPHSRPAPEYPKPAHPVVIYAAREKGKKK